MRAGDAHSCPVCKSGISRETVIPLYARGDGSSRAAAAEQAAGAGAGGAVPGRPRAQRTDAAAGVPRGDGGAPAPDPHGFFGPGARPGNPWDPYGPYAQNNFAFTAGFGFFPSLFGLQFQTFGLGGVAEREVREGGRAHTAEELHQLFLSRVLLALTVLVVFMLLFL
jgi:hypothetical protein